MSRTVREDDIYQILQGYEQRLRRIEQSQFQPLTAGLWWASPGGEADTMIRRYSAAQIETDDIRLTDGKRIVFPSTAGANRWNIDGLNGNFRIFREDSNGLAGAVRLSITDAGAVSIPGSLTVSGTDFSHSGTGLMYIAGAGLRTNNSLGNLHLDPIKPDGTKGHIYLNWYGGTSNGSLIYANGSSATRFTVNTGGQAEVFSSIRATPGASNGSVALVAGGGSNAGYIDWYTPNGNRQAYMGFNTNDTGVTLQMERGIFLVNGGQRVSSYLSIGDGAATTARLRATVANTLDVVTFDNANWASVRALSYTLVGSGAIWGSTGLMFQGYDSWLRINESSNYSSGLYIPGRGVDITGALRIGTGGSLQIGGAGSGGDGTVVIDGNQGVYATHYRTRLVTSHDFYAIYKVSETGDVGGGIGYNQKLYIRNHHGIKYDAYVGGGGHRFYCGYNADGNVAGLLFSIGEGDSVVRSYVHTRVTAGGRTVDVLDGSGNSSFVARTRDMPISKPDVGTDGESGQFWGQIELARTDGNLLRPSITPSENVYYEVTATMWVRVWDQSWNRGDFHIEVIGVASGHRNAVVGHAALYWMSITTTHIFTLNKGTTYTFRALFTPASGGWSYLRGPTYSTITGKVVGFW